jgi:glycosyltransferase involved in cell wall biosynthesis
MVNPLIRGVWRSLPVGLRRAIAHGMVMRFAPGLPAPAPESYAPDAPVVVVGFLTSASGLGQAARLAYRALERDGRDVWGVDLSRFFFETADVVRFDYRDGRRHRGPAHLFVNINAPYLKYTFHLLGAPFLKHKRVTGYWAWELPRAPETWRAGFARVHDAAAPSTFVANAIAALGNAPPIRVIPHPVAVEDIPSIPPRSETISARAPFIIISAVNAASGFARKNPLALIDAFRRAAATDQDWRLRLLVSNVEHAPDAHAALIAAVSGDPRIELTFAALDRDAYWRWYGAPDLYASLHRAEGFGLPLAESMAAGVPVLATNWSGNTEYMDDDTALLVRYRLTPVEDPQRKYEMPDERWAEPDVDHAAELMRRARQTPEWLAHKARAALTAIRARLSSFPLN